MASTWIEHVKAVAKKKGIKYNEALKVASASWKGGKTKPKAGTKGAASKTMPGEKDFTTKKGGARKTARKAYEK